MENIERLQRLNNDKLIDVVKNYKRYGYDEDIRSAAITILSDRGYTIEELGMFGHLENKNYDEAENQYNAFRRNSKIAILTLLLSGGLLFIVYIIILYMAYLNQNNFYQALGKENNSLFVSDIFGVMFYFHIRDKMREELKGVR